MAGLTKGYVIPRLVSRHVLPVHGDGKALTGRDAHVRAHGGVTGVHQWRESAAQNGHGSFPPGYGNAGLVQQPQPLGQVDRVDSDSRLNKRKLYAEIYSKRCIFCKNFHHPTKYCFRLNYLSMANKRKKSRGDQTSSSSSSEESTDSREVSGSGTNTDQEDTRPEDDLGPPFGKDLTSFYDNKKRIDAYEVKLVLQPETVKMYFEKLLADGKMDIESSKAMFKKYYMADKEFARLAPPSLSSTKLHDIQTYDLGGVHNRLMGIHISMRTALKIILRVYESLGGVSQVFEEFKPVHPYSTDQDIADRFVLPSKQDMRMEVSDEEVEKAIPADAESVKDLVKEKLMLEKLVEKQADMYIDTLSDLNSAETMAVIGQKQQESMVDLMWDALQHLGQLDLTIKDAREAKIEEYLTAGFKSSLKAANKDRDTKKERHKKDVLLHPKLDKLVKEESKSDHKVSLGWSVSVLVAYLG
jgi:hypothetical protein